LALSVMLYSYLNDQLIGVVNVSTFI